MPLEQNIGLKRHSSVNGEIVHVFEIEAVRREKVDYFMGERLPVVKLFKGCFRVDVAETRQQ